MDVEFAFICEAADFGTRGTSAIGIGQRLINQSASRLCVVAQIAYLRSDAGRREIEVAVVDPDGGDVDREKSQRDLRPPPEDGPLPMGHITFIGQFRGLRFARKGPYAVQISTPERLLATVPFEVA